MIAREFVEQNKDILVRRMTDADFQNLTVGSVLFCISVAKGNKPLEDRQVRAAGYQMVAAHFSGSDANGEKICTLALTASGYAKIDEIVRHDMCENSNKLLYACKPLPHNDPRNGYSWQI